MNRQPRVLLRTAIDPSALLEYPLNRDQLVHRALVEALRDHGVMTFSQGQFASFYRAIESLSDDSKTLWRKLLGALDDLNRMDRNAPISDLEASFSSLAPADAWKGFLDLVVAEEAAARVHGVDFVSGSRTIGETDIVLAPTVDTSPALKSARNVELFPKGSPRENVEQQLIRPLASRSQTVKLVDPYILEEFVRHGRRPERVEWLLSVLAASLPSGASVSLLGSLHRGWPGDYMANPESRLESLLERTLGSSSKSLTVNVRLVRHTNLRNRFIWFSCGHSYDVLHDFQSLENDTLRREIRFIRQAQEATLATLTAIRDLEKENTQNISIDFTIG